MLSAWTRISSLRTDGSDNDSKNQKGNRIVNLLPRLSLCTVGASTVALALALGACTSVPNAPVPDRVGLVRTAENDVVHIAWGPSSANTLSAEEQELVAGRLHDELSQLAASMPAGWRVSATIRHIETVRPAVNALGTLLIIVPIDRGGIELDFAVHSSPFAAVAAVSVVETTPRTEIRTHLGRVGPALACIPNVVALKTALGAKLAISGA